MKKLFLATTALVAFTVAASAADLPLRSAPSPIVAAVPVFTWTGFYVGVQAGYAWSEDEAQLFVGGVPVGLGTFGVSTDIDSDGFVGGVHAGFNYQIGSFVVGIEGDLEGAGIDGDLTIASPLAPGYSATSSSEINFQGSLRARLGVAFDRALIYATGGLAFANLENTYTATLPAGNILGVAAGSYTQKFDDTEWGWTIGAGVEYAFTDNLTARVEYRYTQFENVDNNFAGFDASIEQEPEFHTVRLGVSYKFNTY
jgi:outer membrane immunogenic protein